MADVFSGGIMPQVIENRQGLQNLEAQRANMDMAQRQQKMQEEAMQFGQQYIDSVNAGNTDSNLLYQATLRSPEMSRDVLNSIGVVDKQQKQRAASDIVTLKSALKTPELFYKALAARIDTIKKNGGDPKDTRELGKMYQAGDIKGVENALNITGAALANEGFIKPEVLGFGAQSGIPSSQQEFEYYQKLQQQNPALAEQYARSKGYIETGREASQTPQERNMAAYKQMVQAGDPDAGNFGISAGLLSKEGRQLDAATTKALQDAMTEAETNSLSVTKNLDLASRVMQADIEGGLFGRGGSWRESFKSAFGMQDEEVSKAMSDWQKIRSGEAIASLPQGPATDADIRLALKPLPENPNGEYLASYLRGMAKMSQYRAEYNQAKADFISENGSLRAKDGTNFGKVWAGQRKDVLDRISKDERFTVTPKAVTTTEAVETMPQQGRTIGRFTVEVEQ